MMQRQANIENISNRRTVELRTRTYAAYAAYAAFHLMSAIASSQERA